MDLSPSNLLRLLYIEKQEANAHLQAGPFEKRQYFWGPQSHHVTQHFPWWSSTEYGRSCIPDMMLDPQFNELIIHPPFFLVTLSTSPYLGCAIAASHYPGLKGAPLHEVYLQWGNANRWDEGGGSHFIRGKSLPRNGPKSLKIYETPPRDHGDHGGWGWNMMKPHMTGGCLGLFHIGRTWFLKAFPTNLSSPFVDFNIFQQHKKPHGGDRSNIASHFTMAPGGLLGPFAEQRLSRQIHRA